jgi:hypothetical protein
MKLAMNEVRALRRAQAKSAVSSKTGEFIPDFHACETDNFIILPWDREIIQGGELVMRPDYAAFIAGSGVNGNSHGHSFPASSRLSDPISNGRRPV